MREESGQSMGDQANELGGGLVTERGEGRLWKENDRDEPVRRRDLDHRRPKRDLP